MADMLGHKAWNRTAKCKRVNCCTRPRRSKSGQRLREERTWQHDLDEEQAPEYPDWIDRFAASMAARCEGMPEA